MKNNFLYFVLLVFIGIDIFGSTGKTLIDEFKREYDFRKDPNSIRAANNINDITIGYEDSCKNFISIREKPKKDGTFYVKQATFQAYACDYSVDSTIHVYKWKNGRYEHVTTQVVPGAETFYRLEKLALETQAFYNGQPSIKTE